jgi:nitrogen-specific signal transduction histidine kinase/CheY-like chemotaxis protein
MDVTEQRRAREQLLQAQKMEAVGSLASGVAHDFNNLLVGILSCSGFLLESMSESDPRRADVEEIREAGERAARLVRQLLTFGRRSSFRPTIVDVNEAVRGLERLLRRTIGEHISIAVATPAEPCLTRIDPGQFEQVLMNLAVNARDAMPNGGQLSIRTRTALVETPPAACADLAPGRYAILAVSDTGCGIAPDVLPRIFEPFFTTKGEGKGTGLGLATTYGIVQEARGRILVDSAVGRGTTITVYLPTADALAGAGAVAERSPRRSGEGRTVLVVEDEDVVRRVARRMLEGAGYRVIEAGTVTEALGRIETTASIQLVLSDVVMPDASGTELAKALVQREPRIPLVFMSGYSEWQRSAPPGRVLEKPFSADTLLHRIEAELGGATVEVKPA